MVRVPRERPEKYQVGVYLTVEHVQGLETLARHRSSTRSAVVRQLVDEALKEFKEAKHDTA
jgi:metal-responsive CopG/Arc/MetJ family transcriptional regulator